MPVNFVKIFDGGIVKIVFSPVRRPCTKPSAAFFQKAVRQGQIFSVPGKGIKLNKGEFNLRMPGNPVSLPFLEIAHKAVCEPLGGSEQDGVAGCL